MQTMQTLTAHDLQHLGERYRETAMECLRERWVWDGPEDVMTSLGYVGLWPDGEVTHSQHGVVAWCDVEHYGDLLAMLADGATDDA